MTFIPFGSIAFKLNLLSALSGAAASVLVFKSVRMLTGDNSAAVFSALLSAFAPLAWAESTKAEVYTLNSALVMSVLYLGLRFLRAGTDRRLLFLISFLIGLGMGNHHTIGFMVFPFALAAVWRARDWRTGLYCALFFLVGIGVYAFGYVRSVKYLADGSLFAYSDMSTPRAFLITLLREEYQSSVGVVASPAHDPLSFFRGLYNVSRYLIYGNFGVLAFFALISIPLFRGRKREMAFALTAFASYAFILSAMVYAFREPKADDLFLLDPYLLPLIYITALLAGCGISFIKEFVSLRLPETGRPFALAVMLLPFVFTLPNALKENNFSRHYLVEDFADNSLDSLPPQSVLIAASDSSTFPLNYKALVEKKREDVLILFGDKEVTMLQGSPRWRLAWLFPDLPFKGPFSRVDADYLMDKTLFAFEPEFLSEQIHARFIPVPYIHGYRLFSRQNEIDITEAGDDFKRAFEVFVYERNLDERASDQYSTELKMSMFIPLAHNAYLMNREGDSARAFKYYGDSLKLITPKGLAHYIVYLKTYGREKEVEAFVEAIEPYAEKYPEVRNLSEEIKRQFL